MMIDLRSDTVTRPTCDMLQAMIKAEVGDDVFGADPTVNALEEKIAMLFGHQAALFCPSGTMTNQLALKTHTQPLDEVICEEYSHIYQYETAGYSYNSGIGIQLIKGPDHKLTPSLIRSAKRPLYDWLPKSKLVVLENSNNKAGGTYYTFDEMAAISSTCKELDMKLHLDGARIFNVLVETGDSPIDVGVLFDSVSVCLSKGLGAPVGSCLIGPDDLIKEARRFRKVMGGGMRQAGYLAAAGIYALEHHVDRLSEDHKKAKEVASVLQSCSFVKNIQLVQTNIIVFDTIESFPASGLVQRLKEKDILAIAFGEHTVRFTFHLDIKPEMIPLLKSALLDVQV